MKLHFSQKNFDVFSCKRVRNTSVENYNNRKDKYIFERLANRFNEPRECVRYYAANYIYGNTNFLYEPGTASDNYVVFNKRRQSISNLFFTDLSIISDSVLNSSITNKEIFQLYINKKITQESLILMNQFNGVIDEMINSEMNLVWEDELLRLKKGERFIKFDKDKITKIYNEWQNN